MTIGDVTKWVTGRLKLNEEDKFSESTVQRWVHKIGFKVHTMKKSIYIDGHERSDVVLSRHAYIKVSNSEISYIYTSIFEIDSLIDSLLACL